MSGHFTRRGFLKAGVLGATGFSIRCLAGDDPKAKSPAERINVGFVGSGGKGSHNLSTIGALVNVAALCDIDAGRLDKAAQAHKGAKKYSDWRKLVEQKDLDAVVVTTPDHSHAVAAMAAMKQGKHVYVEKPLCHNIAEVRALTNMARKKKLATQMGNHGTSSEYIRRQAEWVNSGIIGAVKEIHCWTDRPGHWWPQGLERPADKPPVPEGVAWDVWLGPAPERPYNPAYHPFKWRGWWDFGTGALGDMGCHVMNYPFFALKLGAPSSVECTGSEGQTTETPPKWATIRWEFPAADGRPALPLTWYDGGKKPATPEGIKKMPGNGTLYVGEKGTILATYDGAPELAGQGEYRGPQPSLPRSKGHYSDWVEACKGGPAAGSNFDYSGPLSELVLLGNTAMLAGKKLVWESEKMKIPNAPDAEKFLKRDYRKGWSL